MRHFLLLTQCSVILPFQNIMQENLSNKWSGLQYEYQHAVWHTVQSHQLVKLNDRCRIHSESFITSHCPPWSPTAFSLFSCGALLEICPINVIAGESLTQYSDSFKNHCYDQWPLLPSSRCQRKGLFRHITGEIFRLFFLCEIYLIIPEGLNILIPTESSFCLGIMDLLPCVLSSVN